MAGEGEDFGVGGIWVLTAPLTLQQGWSPLERLMVVHRQLFPFCLQSAPGLFNQ